MSRLWSRTTDSHDLGGKLPGEFQKQRRIGRAEISESKGRALDAMDLYEQAIRSATRKRLCPHEALAYELAARFYAALARRVCQHSMAERGNGFVAWGADGKVRQLDEMYPNRGGRRAPGRQTRSGRPCSNTSTIATVIKKVVAGRLDGSSWKCLLDTLCARPVEQAGAERGLLIVSRGAEPQIERKPRLAATPGRRATARPAVTAAVWPESGAPLCPAAPAESAFSTMPPAESPLPRILPPSAPRRIHSSALP